MIEYKYEENLIVGELMDYIDGTYSEHYADGDIEVTEYLIDKGMGQGHCLGNVIKYASRYGKKDGFNRKDLLKIAHYAVMMIYVHDLEEKNRPLT